MSGSNSGGQTTTNSGLAQEFLPYARDYLNSAGQVAQQPYEQFNGPRVANLSSLQNQAMSGYGGLLSDPSWKGAQGTYSDLQSGSMNPYMQQVGQTVTNDVTRAYNQATAGTRSSYNTPGNFGSTRQDLAQDHNDENLARGLSAGLGGLYSGEWDSMQNRRLQGAQGAGNLASTYSGILGNSMTAGGVGRGFDQQVIDANYGDWQRAQNYPQQQLQIFGNALSPFFGGGGMRQTTTQEPGPDQTSQALAFLSMLGSYR